MKHMITMLTLLGLCVAVGAQQPPLAEVARKAEEERAKGDKAPATDKTPTKVYTNKEEDLKQPATVFTLPSPSEWPKAAPGSFASAIARLEATSFCKKYRCTRDKEWELKDGGINHTYRFPKSAPVRDADYILLEAPTNYQGEVSHVALMFNGEHEQLANAESELEMINALLETLNAQGLTPTVRRFVRENIDRHVERISDARPIEFGRYLLRAGTVFNEQRVSLEVRPE